MNPEEFYRFLGLPKGAFDHIPAYARHGALKAIAKVRELEEKQIFRPGLYYIALIDLTASTESSAALGHELNTRRVETFITACVEALGSIDLKSYAQFVKEIGDATLFIFTSFDDLFSWWNRAEEEFLYYNQEWEHKLEPEEYRHFQIRAKTVVHLGEVSYITKANPLALAINQVFKIEKLFLPYQLGCTHAVRSAAAPNITSFALSPTSGQAVVLPGDSEETQTWVLAERQQAQE